jgi:ribonuclease E
MANKMLIDATHPEETRVVVLRGNRVEEFDFESAQRKQLRGNIYLAKVTRVEPSLQAAFVDYGGNRHGFLAFSEIHPDYYQIPVADRQALIDEEERAQRAADDEADRRPRRHRHRGRPARRNDEAVHGDAAEAPAGGFAGPDQVAETLEDSEPPSAEPTEITAVETPESQGDIALGTSAEPHEAEGDDASHESASDDTDEADESAPATLELTAVTASVSGPTEIEATPQAGGETSAEASQHEVGDHGEMKDQGDAERGGADDHGSVEEVNGAGNGHDNEHENGHDEEVVESVGGSDAMEEVPDRAPRYRRQYKIQEVIKRRQVMLVQVVKEERGTKGAALTTYLSLAGRYSVLMPNTARGGGISRKITSAEDRARLKEAAADLEVPEGMGVILRTAGASRTKVEIKRDFEYLLRMWETVRDLTLKSTAPKLVYEEGSLIKRSIRDLYGKEIDEVIVAGDDAYHEAKDFMRMLMPSHAKSVKSYSDTQPLLSRYGVESQLDAMFSPVVQLRSGGYIVINQAEALVAIDVNSGRATREHHIEDTALKTNLEASDEIARQLRLRDLAGLIVIDFIDMDEKRNNRSVERRLKEALKHDRARIQVGRISHFGLLEMSRQRIRTSVLESSTEKCPYCGGSGHVRSVSSLALQVLRALEEQLMKSATHNLIARTRSDVAAYVLNQKRAHLRALEERFAITIMVVADETVPALQAFVVDRGEQVHSPEQAREIAEQHQAEAAAAPLEEEDDLEDESIVDEVEEEQAAEAEASPAPAESDDGESGEPRRRRRRRGRGGRNGRDNGEQRRYEQIPINDDGSEPAGEHFVSSDDAVASDDAAAGPHGEPDNGQREERPEYHGERQGQDAEGSEHDGGRRRRRRGRRGGRNRQENRQERNGNGGSSRDEQQPQHDFASGDQFPTPAASESLTHDAMADFAVSPAAAPTPVIPEPSMPEPEAPRRRSTVREPAPVSSGESFAPTPSPTPVVTPAPEPAAETITTEDASKPRKTGWWSKRFGG